MIFFSKYKEEMIIFLYEVIFIAKFAFYAIINNEVIYLYSNGLYISTPSYKKCFLKENLSNMMSLELFIEKNMSINILCKYLISIKDEKYKFRIYLREVV